MAQQFSTHWDIDNYYDDTEPEQHWELRKAFMEVHKTKFPEDYLVALAKTFTNIEFLGCVYPAPVMIRIAELSKDVAKQYRETKKTKLQRTFVTASRAAENKFADQQILFPLSITIITISSVHIYGVKEKFYGGGDHNSTPQLLSLFYCSKTQSLPRKKYWRQNMNQRRVNRRTFFICVNASKPTNTLNSGFLGSVTTTTSSSCRYYSTKSILSFCNN